MLFIAQVIQVPVFCEHFGALKITARRHYRAQRTASSSNLYTRRSLATDMLNVMGLGTSNQHLALFLQRIVVLLMLSACSAVTLNEKIKAGGDVADTKPVAESFAAAPFNEDVESIITLQYADEELDPATECQVSAGASSSASTCSCVEGVCSVGITGAPNYNGSDALTFTVSSNGLVSDAATLTIELLAVNDAPEAPASIDCASPIELSEDNICTVTEASTTDVESDAISYEIDDSGTCEDAVMTNDLTGELTYTAPADGVNCTLKVRAVDAHGAASTSVSLTQTGYGWTRLATADNIAFYENTLQASADGQELIAIRDGDQVVLSADFGESWSNVLAIGNAWGAVAMDSTGQILTACSGAYPWTGDYGIYRSTDGGTNWTSPAYVWGDDPACALSPNGQALANWTGNGDGGYVTTYDGSSGWAGADSPAAMRLLSMSFLNNGSMLAGFYGGDPGQRRVYYKRNDGLAWGNTDPTEGVGAQASLRLLAAAATGTRLFVTESGGTNRLFTGDVSSGSWDWTLRSIFGDPSIYAIASSADGERLAAAEANGHIYISSDAGATWTKTLSTGSRTWVNLVSSHDGKRFTATANNGGGPDGLAPSLWTLTLP